MTDWESYRPLKEEELNEEIRRIMEGESDEESVGGSDSEDDPDIVVMESNTKYEQSADEEVDESDSENDVNVSNRSKPVLRGRNDYRWTTEPPERRGHRQEKSLVILLTGLELSRQLAELSIRSRLQSKTLHRPLRITIEDLLEIQNNTEEVAPLQKRVRCASFVTEKDRETKMLCRQCRKAICDEHKDYLCIECGLAQTLIFFIPSIIAIKTHNFFRLY